MMQKDVYAHFKKELDAIKKDNSYRFLKTIQTKDDKYVIYNNKKYINLSSNDYLGLAKDKKTAESFYSELKDDNLIDAFGLGGASSRLLTGFRVHKKA